MKACIMLMKNCILFPEIFTFAEKFIEKSLGASSVEMVEENHSIAKNVAIT